jgi:hypothetical protein
MAQQVLQQYKHYVIKMDTQRISDVIDAIKEEAFGNFSTEISDFYIIREAARTYLCSVGTPVSLFAQYFGFAQQTRKYAKKYGGTTLTNLIQGIKNVYEERNLTDATLIGLAALQGITVT